MTDPDRDFLADHLREVPIFRALLRSVECRWVAGAGPFAGPVLDLGCGDGHFASQFEEGGGWIGVDLDPSAIREARNRSPRRSLVLADSGMLPFPDTGLGTVIANSVLEHIPDLDRTISEIHRALKPGGLLVLTAPSDRFAEMLFFPSLFARVGLHRLGKAYGDWFNGHSRHFHTDSIAIWTDRLEACGFRVEEATPYFSRRAHWVFDWTHYLSLPRWVSHRLFGGWVLFPNLWSQRILHRLLSRHVREAPADPGAYLYLRARKSGPVRLV